jgi:hypothetical protein
MSDDDQTYSSGDAEEEDVAEETKDSMHILYYY